MDIPAKVYASMMTANFWPMFRFTAILTETVDPVCLQQALGLTFPRFPYFAVSLREGFFWHYFQGSEQKLMIDDDDDRPFSPPAKQRPLFRVCYHARKISVEINHTQTDGYGAVIFLKTLLAQYFRLQGLPVAQTHGILNIQETPDPEESEDAYLRYCRPGPFRIVREMKAYHVTGKTLAGNDLVLNTGVMKTQDVLRKAHEHHCSITEYLAAVLVQSLQTQQRREKPARQLPIKLSISADLRRFNVSKTLRNFSYVANLGIDPGREDHTLEEILGRIRQQSRSMFTISDLNERMSEIMRYYILLKGAPLFLKKAIIRLIYARIGERAFTMVFTNMGMVELPESIRDKIERFESIANCASYIKLKCGVISYRDTLSVGFTSALEHSAVQERFFTLLEGEGIPVRKESNKQAAK
jgi:hypothetical protein